jgi:aminoglycoside phosphotransferase family enzyme
VAFTPAVYRQHLTQSVLATQRELLLPLYALPADGVKAVGASLLTVLEREPTLFDRRAQSGRIVEAHGDLRPEHICLEVPPAIIDCLEFDRDLRSLDPVSELAFLALECARLGALGIGALVLKTYGDATGDRPPEALVTFYWRFHAYHRAKIAVWHLKEPDLGDPETWRSKAEHYLQLACWMRPQGKT